MSPNKSKQPQIRYLITESQNSKIRGDSRIYDVLIEKDEQAQKNIGDPSEFTRRYDSESEEDQVAEIIGGNETNGADILADLFDTNFLEGNEAKDNTISNKQSNPLQEVAESVVSTDSSEIQELTSLYKSNIDFAGQALEYIKRSGQRLEFNIIDTANKKSTLTLTINKELEQRLKLLTPEIYPKDSQFILTEDIKLISEEIINSRGEEHAWPRIHFLWQLHPVMEWLNDKVLSAFGRHHAPLIRMPHHLKPNQHQFLLSAIFPNRKSHPLIHDWIVVCFESSFQNSFQNSFQKKGEQSSFDKLQTFDEFLQQINLGDIKLSNPIKQDDPDNTLIQQNLLPQAIEKAKQHFDYVRNAKEDEINDKLQQQVDALEKLRGKRIQQMELDLSSVGGIAAIIEDKKAKEQRRIEKLFDDYIGWIEDTMTTEKEPYIQVIAAFSGSEGKGEEV